RARRHRRLVVRRYHAGAHGARAAAPPRGDLAGRRADELVPASVARGRCDAAAHVLGALHPRAGRAGHSRRLGRPARGLGRPEEPATTLLGDTLAERPTVAQAYTGARAVADRLLHA